MISQEDVNNLKMFKVVLNSCDFQLKGNAVKQAALLFQWFDGLEAKFNETIKHQKAEGAPTIKKIGE